LDRLELGLCGIGAVILALPLDHVGVVRGLAVDRPGRAVVVRRRHPSLVVDMGEDLESEIRVLVEHLQAARHLLAAIGLDEGLVREQLLELQANLFPALGAAVAGENGAAIRHELIEVVGHCCLPGNDMAPSFAHRAGKRQSYGAPLGLTLSPTGERGVAEFAAPSSAMALSKACPSSSASAALIRASSVAPELLRPSKRGTTTTSLSNLACPRSWVSP